MTEFVIGPGGTIIPAKQYLDDISEDGGKQEKSTKRDLYHELSTTEKVKVNNFLKEHPELTTSPERAKLFQEKAAKELIEVRNEDFKRTKEGKAPLARHEKELVLSQPGVIRSVWRHQEFEKEKMATMEAQNNRILDDLGYGQR